MRKVVLAFAIVLVAATMAFAQSSGNFSATGSGVACVLNNGTGAITGGIPGSSWTTDISTSGGNGVTLDIRPDFVTGLFTSTKISQTTVSSATADIGIQVCVQVDDSSLDPALSPVKPAPCVVYDQRFQQITSQLFSQLTECTAAVDGNCNTGVACNLTAMPPVPCAVGTCSAAAGPGTCSDQSLCTVAGSVCNTTTGQCIGNNPNCNFTLVLATLSAHSFDFIVPVDNKKPHVVKTSWNVIGPFDTVGGNATACAGPGVTTVTQVKVFNNSGALTF